MTAGGLWPLPRPVAIASGKSEHSLGALRSTMISEECNICCRAGKNDYPQFSPRFAEIASVACRKKLALAIAVEATRLSLLAISWLLSLKFPERFGPKSFSGFGLGRTSVRHFAQNTKSQPLIQKVLTLALHDNIQTPKNHLSPFPLRCYVTLPQGTSA